MYEIKNISTIEAFRIASDEEAVEKLFIDMRWPGGISCPRCGNMKVWPRRNRKPSMAASANALMTSL